MKEFWDESDINGRTRCWAQGMDGWRPLEQVAQLKWQLMATGNALMNESEMTTLVLNMLIRVCSFYKSRLGGNASTFSFCLCCLLQNCN